MAKSKFGSIFLVVLLDLIGFGIIIPLLPLYALNLNASKFEIGILMSMYSLAQFIFAPIWGSLSDVHGRKKILLLTLTGSMLGALGTAYAGSLMTLFIFRFFAGMMAGNVSVASAMIADLSVKEERTKGMALIGISFGLGFIIGPAIGAFLSVDGNIKIPYFFSAFLTAINIIIASKTLPDPKVLSSSHGSALKRLKFIFSGKLPSYLILVLLTFFFLTSAIASMETSIPIFLKNNMGTTPRDFGILMSCFGVIMVIVQGGIVRRISHRVSDQTLFLIGISLFAIAFLSMINFPSLNGIIFSFCVLGVGYGLSQPSLQSFVSKNAASDIQGSILGTYHSLGALARGIVPLLAGFLYQKYDFYGPFQLNFFLALIALIISQIIWVKTKRI